MKKNVKMINIISAKKVGNFALLLLEKVLFPLATVSIAFFAHNLEKIVDNHQYYMERLNYYYTFVVDENHHYMIDDQDTGVASPQIVINLKTGGITNAYFLTWNNGKIGRVEAVKDIDIEETKADYKDLKEGYLLTAEMGGHLNGVGDEHKKYIPYYLLLEGLNGDNHLDLIVEEIDFDKGEASIQTYDYLESLATTDVDQEMLQCFEEYQQIYEYLQEKGIEL